MTDQTFSQSQSKAQPKVIAEGVSFEDFVQQYDGQPVEWHAEKVLEIVSNNETHQVLLGFLYTLLNLYLGITKVGKVYLDGYPMFISNDLPAHQPDLLIVLNENLERVQATYLEGAADIVVEIVSPSSEDIDRGEKFIEYEQAGVKEYWLIDPIRDEAFVYVLSADGYYKQRPNDGKLSSTLLDGFELSLDILWDVERPEGLELIQLAQDMAQNAKRE